MTDLKQILRIADAIENIGLGQLAIEPTIDPTLGFKMVGAKDHTGGVQRFLAKGKPGLLDTLVLSGSTTTDTSGLLRHDSFGSVVGGLIPLATLNSLISDATLDDSSSERPPSDHATSHEPGGSDAITVLPDHASTHNVGGSDPITTVVEHAATHEDGGTDAIDISNISGQLADPQIPEAHRLGGAYHTADLLANINALISDATLDDTSTPRMTPMTMGWEDIFSYSLDFNTTTRILTIDVPTNPVPRAYYKHWQFGIEYNKTSPEQITLPDEEGWHFVYYELGVLQRVKNPTREDVLNKIRNNPLVCYIYWDATNKVVVRFLLEPHTIIMSTGTHSNMHSTSGVKFSRGLALNSIVPDSTSPSAVNGQFGVDSGSLADEDVPGFPNGFLSTVGTSILTFEGAVSSPDLRTNTNGTFSFLQGPNGRLVIQEDVGGTYVNTECTDNMYAAYHVYGDNSLDPDNAIFTVPGRSQHTTVADAVAVAESESITIKSDGKLGPEILRIGSVIFRTRTAYANPAIYTTPDGGDYLDYRFAQGGAGGAATTAQQLNDLTDVTAATPSHGDRLAYDGTLAVWVNTPYRGCCQKVTNVSAATYTALSTDDTLDVTYVGVTTITLPIAEVLKSGRMLRIRDNRFAASLNNIVVETEGSSTINGENNLVINSDGTSVDLQSDGTNWMVV